MIMAFTVYEVIRVSCLSRSWFVYAPWAAQSRLWFPLSMLLRNLQNLGGTHMTNRFQNRFYPVEPLTRINLERFALQN